MRNPASLERLSTSLTSWYDFSHTLRGLDRRNPRKLTTVQHFSMVSMVLRCPQRPRTYTTDPAPGPLWSAAKIKETLEKCCTVVNFQGFRYLGAILAHLGAILAHLGAILGHLSAFLAPSWGILVPFWRILAHLGAILAYLRAILAHLGAILAHLGDILAHLGAILAHLGDILAHLGAILAHLGPS